jgi:hypothetical protein
MKKIVRLTESDIMNLVKRVISEQDEQNTHRYNQGVESPGIEQYLINPVDKTISNGLSNQLRNDPYGKGKIVIIFNGEKFKEPGAFMNKIQNDFNAGNCYEITNYEYNNRILFNTQIKITAKSGKCKKEEVPVKPITPVKTETPIKRKKPSPKCKYEIKLPVNLLNKYFEGGDMKSKIFSFQKRYCNKMKPNGIWGCATQTCYIENNVLDKIRRSGIS